MLKGLLQSIECPVFKWRKKGLVSALNIVLPMLKERGGMLAQCMEECIAAAQITLGSKGAIDAVALVPALVDGMADADADVTFAHPLAGVQDDRSTDLSLAERVQGGAEDAKAMADAKMKQA